MNILQHNNYCHQIYGGVTWSELDLAHGTSEHKHLENEAQSYGHDQAWEKDHDADAPRSRIQSDEVTEGT